MEAYNNFILSFMYQFMYKHMEFYSIASVAFGNIYQNTQDLQLGEFVFGFAEMNFLYRLRFLFLLTDHVYNFITNLHNSGIT